MSAYAPPMRAMPRGGYRNGPGRVGYGRHGPSASYGDNPDRPNKKKIFRVVRGTGDIFSFESPKAYAPLGYRATMEPRVLRPQDFDAEAPLPIYPERPCQVISIPVGATFDDTESHRPNNTPARPLISRTTKENDPIVALVKRSHQGLEPLMLGDEPLFGAVTEKSATLKLISKTDAMLLSTPQSTKRERENYDAEESVKRHKRDFRIKIRDDESPEVNNNTVRPENVLRMVDSSLVETPPDKYGETPRAQMRRYPGPYPGYGDGSPAVATRVPRYEEEEFYAKTSHYDYPADPFHDRRAGLSTDYRGHEFSQDPRRHRPHASMPGSFPDEYPAPQYYDDYEPGAAPKEESRPRKKHAINNSRYYYRGGAGRDGNGWR